MPLRNPLRRLRLGTLLIGFNVGLLLLAVAGVAYAASALLQQLADDQALARAAQAGLSAQNAIAQAGREVLSDTQLLGERPTLRRLLNEDNRDALTAFLAQFGQTSLLDGSAVLRDGAVVASGGTPIDWESLWAGRRAYSDSFVARAGDALLIGGRWPVQSNPGADVMAIVWLDEAFAQQIRDEIGLQVDILMPPSTANDALTEQRLGVTLTGRASVARLDSVNAYVALNPLYERSTSGEVVGLVETRLPTTAVVNSLGQFVRTLVTLTALVAALAALASLLFGGWLARPLQRLTNAAARIGRGDLATPLAVYSPGGEMGTLTATFEDMRRRLMQLTADLRRQQAESDAIVTSIIEGVYSVDRERRIRYINPQMAAMLGLDAPLAVGRFCGDVLNPKGPDGARPCEEQCPIVHARFRSGARATEHLQLRNGQQRSVVITSAPPSDNQQVQVMRDETEVEATRRLRDAVLANISHEFRTPLSAQLASIELLLDQLPDLTTDQIAELVVRLQRSTLRLTQLIDNLLESVRIEAGEYGIRRKPVSMDEVVEQALELMRPLLSQRDQDVAVDLPYPFPAISGDAQRLTQVLVNLLANANKFSPEGSMIRLGGAVGPATVSLWVADQGPGIPDNAGQSLFTRFIRSTGEEPDQGGVGLGLWIVKSIVERHGGRVDALSDASGTRMCITLPRESHLEDPRR